MDLIASGRMRKRTRNWRSPPDLPPGAKTQHPCEARKDTENQEPYFLPRHPAQRGPRVRLPRLARERALGLVAAGADQHGVAGRVVHAVLGDGDLAAETGGPDREEVGADRLGEAGRRERKEVGIYWLEGEGGGERGGSRRRVRGYVGTCLERVRGNERQARGEGWEANGAQ